MKLQYSHTVGFMSLQGGKGFANPIDLEFDQDGIMYVLSRGSCDLEDEGPSKRVTKCTVDEQYLGQFSRGGTGDGEIMWPSSIAIDQHENVYISDEALHRISVFDKSGEFQFKWGAKGNKNGEFNRPSSITFDDDFNLLVVDALNNRIQKYKGDGEFVSQWGKAGSQLGEMNIPWGVTTDLDGHIYVSDWRNDRIQKFDKDGNHMESWGGSEESHIRFHRPSGIAIDSRNNLYVSDWGNEQVQIISQDGTQLAQLRGNSGLSKWANEYFTTNLDELEEREKANMEPELAPETDDFARQQSANIEKLFWGPTTVKLDKQEKLYVVDTGRARIQIYTQGK